MNNFKIKKSQDGKTTFKVKIRFKILTEIETLIGERKKLYIDVNPISFYFVNLLYPLNKFSPMTNIIDIMGKTALS